MKKLYEFRATLALIIGMIGLFSLWLNGYTYEYQSNLYGHTYTAIARFISQISAMFGMAGLGIWATKSQEAER